MKLSNMIKKCNDYVDTQYVYKEKHIKKKKGKKK